MMAVTTVAIAMIVAADCCIVVSTSLYSGSVITSENSQGTMQNIALELKCLKMQGVPGGMCQTSEGCSLC